MRHLRLSTLLVMLNVALLLLAVSGVAFVAVNLLRQLADEQALARVGQAGSIALREVERAGDDTLTTAQVLAERPTLNQLTQGGNVPALVGYLQQYRQSSHLDVDAVIQGNQALASSGGSAPPALLGILKPSGSGQSLVRQVDGSLVLGAWASMSSVPNAMVITVRFLNAAFAAQVRGEIGLPVAIVDRQSVLAGSHGSEKELRAQALASGQSLTGRLDSPPIYVAIQPMRDATGAVVGVLEVDLPSSETTNSVGQLVASLLLLAVVVAVGSAAVSVYVGRRLGAPLFALTSAAARMGTGDLATPLRPSRSTELGAEVELLTAGLEDMRKRLLRLTSDLRKQQAEAQAIVTGIVEGVFAVDRERRIQYINPQAARLLGIAPDKAMGRFCGDVLRPWTIDGVRPCEHACPIIHARFQGGARATEQLQVAEGVQRTVVVASAAPVEGQQVQVVRDETEVETTRRLRDAVLANISHEFKTPLAAQHASVELLLDRLPELSRDEVGVLVLALQRGTARLTQLIDNLLESVRLEAGEDHISHQAVRLDEVVEDAVELTRSLFGLREQRLEVALPYPLPVVMGDAARLRQVFVNLLANANKYAPMGTAIVVGGDVAPHHVTLWVEDAGPGLPQDARESIFERFARGASSEMEQSGMGLGLWIVKSIIERHGGQVVGETLLGADGTVAGARMSVVLQVEQGNEGVTNRR